MGTRPARILHPCQGPGSGPLLVGYASSVPGPRARWKRTPRRGTLKAYPTEEARWMRTPHNEVRCPGTRALLDALEEATGGQARKTAQCLRPNSRIHRLATLPGTVP